MTFQETALDNEGGFLYHKTMTTKKFWVEYLDNTNRLFIMMATVLVSFIIALLLAGEVFAFGLVIGMTIMDLFIFKKLYFNP